MEPLFTLLHDPPGGGRIKIIGVYSSEDLALAATQRARSLPGFIDEPDCFRIERYEIDKDHWPRGFMRL